MVALEVNDRLWAEIAMGEVRATRDLEIIGISLSKRNSPITARVTSEVGGIFIPNGGQEVQAGETCTIRPEMVVSTLERTLTRTGAIWKVEIQ